MLNNSELEFFNYLVVLNYGSERVEEPDAIG
jgi:hypothetical protein